MSAGIDLEVLFGNLARDAGKAPKMEDSQSAAVGDPWVVDNQTLLLDDPIDLVDLARPGAVGRTATGLRDPRVVLARGETCADVASLRRPSKHGLFQVFLALDIPTNSDDLYPFDIARRTNTVGSQAARHCTRSLLAAAAQHRLGASMRRHFGRLPSAAAASFHKVCFGCLGSAGVPLTSCPVPSKCLPEQMGAFDDILGEFHIFAYQAWSNKGHEEMARRFLEDRTVFDGRESEVVGTEDILMKLSASVVMHGSEAHTQGQTLATGHEASSVEEAVASLLRHVEDHQAWKK